MFLPLSVKKNTVCELEADVLAHHIANREQVTSGHIAANPGIECLWEDERQRRQNKGDTSELQHLLELTRVDVPPTKSHVIFKQALKERLSMFTSEKNIVDKINSSGEDCFLKWIVKFGITVCIILVYPAETPENVRLQPASDNDSDITSSLELSLDDTVCDLDVTMTNEMSMREEDEELFNILNKLGKCSAGLRLCGALDLKHDGVLLRNEKNQIMIF